MRSFLLQILTPECVCFDGQAEKMILCGIEGELAVLAGHTDYVTVLKKGRAMVESSGQRRYAQCDGGMLSVMDGKVTVLSPAFVWE